MTQEERWNKKYDEVVGYMNRYHRNPSKHRIEDHLMLNWMKHQRKLMNRGELQPDRVERFKMLMTKGERYKRENQYVELDVSILNEDALREYQQSVLANLQREWQEHRSVMVQMPTVTGKTHLMAEAIRAFLAHGARLIAETQGEQETIDENENRRVLVVAHRRELIEQIGATLTEYEVKHGIVDGQHRDTDIQEHDVLVASIQTLDRRAAGEFQTERPKFQGDGNYEPALVIIDEAHHALAETYKHLWDWWPETKFLGLTATPCRLSGKPFTDLFDSLLQSWPLKRFIEEGWLSDLDYVSVGANSITIKKVASLDKRGTDGDFQTKQMANVLDTPESIEHLYRSYMKFADGKKGIVYAINRTHTRHIAEYYREHGLNACGIDSQTPAQERKELMDGYREGRIKILVNCDLYGAGLDVGDVEFIQLARPTLSLSKYLQQVGRGMRVTKDKREVTILDQVGLYLLFGMPTDDRDWGAMFRGEQKGKGRRLADCKGWTKDSGDEKLLVNEEMHRIKDVPAKKEMAWVPDSCERHGEVYGELEVFRERGLNLSRMR